MKTTKWTICWALPFLLNGAIVLAQRTQPPNQTPPTFPQEQVPGQMPPDSHAPPPQETSSMGVEQQIQNAIQNDSSLTNSDVTPSVDDQSVTLSGTVNDGQQRDTVLKIAGAFAGGRRIVDQMRIQPGK